MRSYSVLLCTYKDSSFVGKKILLYIVNIHGKSRQTFGLRKTWRALGGEGGQLTPVIFPGLLCFLYGFGLRQLNTAAILMTLNAPANLLSAQIN